MKTDGKNVIDRVLDGDYPDPSVLLDGLAEMFPLIDDLAGTPQDPDWHAEGDVRIHTEMVVEECFRLLESEAAAGLSDARRAALVLGAALHDIGKALTTKERELNGKIRIVSPRHAARGRSYVAARIFGTFVPLDICNLVLGLVGHHHDPKKLVMRNAPGRSFFRASRCADLELVYLMEIADIRGRICKDDQSQLEWLELFRMAAEEAGAWGGADVVEPWRERIEDLLKAETEKAVRYAVGAGIRAFENGKIFTPDEVVPLTWEHRQEYPEVIVTFGLSGSGKTTWVDEQRGDFERISLDEIREEITGRRDSQSKNGQVLQIAKERLREGLRRKQRIVWEATSLRADGRAVVTGLAHDYHGLTRIVVFPTSLDTIYARNRKREHALPTAVINRQLESLEWPEVVEAYEVTIVEDEKEKKK